MRFDLHVHTDISPCSNLALETILTRAQGLGLDGICLTDHDTMDVLSSVREGLQENGLVVIVGMEYATDEGDYLIFGPFENIRPGMSAYELIPQVHEAGGAIIGAHPYRLKRPADTGMFSSDLCPIVEVANGPQMENSQALAMAQKRNLAMSAGSDAHTLEELGRYPTRILNRIRTRDDLVGALRAGNFRPTRQAYANGLPRLRAAS